MTRPRFFPAGLAALALAGLTAGCESARTGAGFTNPNAGSMTGREKAATSTDLPVPATGLGKDAAVAEGVASENSGTDVLPTTKSTSGVRQTSPEASTSPPATPPTKENAGSAAGATKPLDKINTGTPRGPQL